MEEELESDEKTTEGEEDDSEFIIDFTTSSAINKISLKFLFVYLPIFWFSGLVIATIWYAYSISPFNFVVKLILLPLIFLVFIFTFIFSFILLQLLLFRFQFYFTFVLNLSIFTFFFSIFTFVINFSIFYLKTLNFTFVLNSEFFSPNCGI